MSDRAAATRETLIAAVDALGDNVETRNWIDSNDEDQQYTATVTYLSVRIVGLNRSPRNYFERVALYNFIIVTILLCFFDTRFSHDTDGTTDAVSKENARE